MSFAVLGDIEFNLITYLSGFEAQFGADYAEHNLINGKPRLQFTADRLDEIKIALFFHAAYCNPTAELARLKQAMLLHKAMSLVLGNGEYKGRFVLTEIGAISEFCDSLGNLYQLRAHINLKEFVEVADKKQPNGPAVNPAKPNDKAVATVAGAKADPRNQSQLGEFARTASGALKQATTATSAVMGIVSVARSMTNPLAALSQVGGLTQVLGNCSNALGNAFPALQTVLPSKAYLADATAAVSAAMPYVSAAQIAVAGASSGSIFTALGTVNTAMTAAQTQLNIAKPGVTRLDGEIATRKI